MWHTLHNVATNRFLDPASFTEFATRLENRTRFGLDDQNMVSTWFCNDLVAAYKATKTQDQLDDERDRQITLYRKRLKGV